MDDLRRGLAAALVLFVVLGMGTAAVAKRSSPTTTKRIHGTWHGRLASFPVRVLRGHRIVSAHVTVGGRRRAVSVARVRRSLRSGRLVVRAPARRKKPAPRRPAPAKSPPGPAPASAGSPAAEPSAPTVLQVVVAAPAPPSAPATPSVPAGDPAPATAPAPAADPTPSGSCPAALALFAGGAGPPACWRPYADTSPFNRPIPASPRLASRSADWVAQLVRRGGPQALPAGAAGTADDWAHPTYYALPTDPAYTVHCAASWGRCAIEGAVIRVPAAARAAAGGDGHMTVVDTVSGWEYDFWQVTSKPAAGGTLVASWGGRTRIDGDGLGSDATAARYGNLAGMIRAPELAAGRIDHALFMTYPCDAQTWVYPARKGGAHCADQSSAFPMGTRFQLDLSDAEIAALGLPAWKRAIVTALAHYGMYFGDTGGTSWAVMAESSSSYTSFGLADPLLKIARDAGIRPGSDGIAWMDLAGGIDWGRRLRALDPCTADGTC